MPAGITATDRIAYAGATPWHGLGRELPEHCTPREALTATGLDWDIVPQGLQAVPPKFYSEALRQNVQPHPVAVDDRVMLTRSDTGGHLGIVSNDYRPFSNADLVDFIGDVLGDDFAAVETAGSLHGGRRVWFALRQGLHDVAGVDPVASFSLFATGHDGGLSIRVIPTEVRVVCANTFSAAGAHNASQGLSIAHRGNVAASIDRARHVLAGTADLHAEFLRTADRLALTDADAGWLSDFFQRAYVGAVASSEQRRLLITNRAQLTAEEQPKRDRAEARAASMVSDWVWNFEDADGGNCSPKVSRTRWAAVNSITRDLDHGRTRKSAGHRFEANVMSDGAALKARIIDHACAG